MQTLTPRPEPEIQAFLADCDATFGPDFDRMGLHQQRAAYDLFWRRYDAPRPEGVRVEEVLVPTPEGGRRALLYRPDPVRPGRRAHADATGLLPVLLYFHGGGWVFGSPESHDLITARLCAEAEAAVLSLDYRLSPEHCFPTALMDCLAALRWVVTEGPARNLASDRLALAGDSAGANLAAGTSLWLRDKKDRRISLQALVYPVLSCKKIETGTTDSGGISAASMDFYLSAYFGGENRCADPYAMPLSAHSFAGLPPTFIATAGLDPLRRDGEAFATALRAAGVRVEYRCAEGLPHTYLRTIHFCRAASAELAAMSRAIRRALAPGPGAGCGKPDHFPVI